MKLGGDRGGGGNAVVHKAYMGTWTLIREEHGVFLLRCSEWLSGGILEFVDSWVVFIRYHSVGLVGLTTTFCLSVLVE